VCVHISLLVIYPRSMMLTYHTSCFTEDTAYNNNYNIRGVGHDVIACMTLCNFRDEKLNVLGSCIIVDAEID